MRELLNGVYDLHIHTSPDVVPRKYLSLIHISEPTRH